MEILYFTATWCQPCKIFGPEMEKVGNQYKVHKIDIENEPTLVDKYGIMSVPTVVVFDGYEELGRFVGARTEQWVLDFIGETNRSN